MPNFDPIPEVNIIVVEFLDEAKALLASYGKSFFVHPQTRVICLHPKVRAFLKNQGIGTEDTVAYFDNEAQHRIILKAEELTAALVGKMVLKDGFGLEKGYEETSFYFIRSYVNHLLWIIEVLEGLFKKHHIKELYCCIAEDSSKMYSDGAAIEDHERFLGLLARDFCQVKKIKFFGRPLKTRKKDFFKTVLIRIVRKINGFFAAFAYRDLVRKSAGHKAVIIPALSYRMDGIVRELKSRYPDVRCVMMWETKSTLKQELFRLYFNISNYLKKARKQNLLDCILALDLIKTKQFRKDLPPNPIAQEFDKLNQSLLYSSNEILIYRNIFLGNYLSGKIHLGLRREILSLEQKTKILVELFSHLRPRLVMSMYSVGLYYMMGEAAYLLELETLNISHGTHVPPNNEFERIENYRLGTTVILNTYQNVAVQTPWAEKFLDYYGDNRNRLVTGPLLYSCVSLAERKKLRRNLLGQKQEGFKVIVHAATQKTRGGLRFHIAETLDEYLSTLWDIVNAVNELEKTYLIIRPHPACDLTEEEFRVLLPQCQRMSIVDKGSFSKVLSAADLLVSYSSTCIEEAIQNDIPVLLFDKWKRYNHFGLPELADLQWSGLRPAYYLTRQDLLKETIQKIFEAKDAQKSGEDDFTRYRFEAGARSNFSRFVDNCLNGGRH